MWGWLTGIAALYLAIPAVAAEVDDAAAGFAIYRMDVGQIVERRVFSKAGENLGRVEQVVLDRGERPHVMVQIGGFLGLGGAPVAIPVSVLRVSGEDLVMVRPIPGREVFSTYPYREAAFRPLPRGRTIAESTTAAPKFSAWFTFERVDRDGDGVITASEARRNVEFRRNWQALDQNRDGHVDQVEFGAFEHTWPRVTLSELGG